MKIYKQVISTMVCFTLLLTSLIIAKPMSVNASSYTFLDITGSSQIGEGKEYNFKVDKTCTLCFSMLASNVLEGSMHIYDSKGREVFNQPYTASNWTQVGDYYLHAGSINNFKSGKYKVCYNFMSPASYFQASVYRKNKAVLNTANIELTKGLSKTLKVEDGNATSWTSSNKKIATVDKNGKVTAKKKGECTITATVGSEELLCQVTVFDNVYEQSLPEATHSCVSYGISKISYDNNGNVIVKVNVSNQTLKKVNYLKDIKITLKQSSKKKIAEYKIDKIYQPLKAGQSKTISIKIAKKNLQIKSADLRLMKKPVISIKKFTK